MPRRDVSEKQFFQLEIDQSDPWVVTAADLTLIAAKYRSSRLNFAVLLLFFRANGRFPRLAKEISAGTIEALARELKVDGQTPETLVGASRTLERHRAEIRALFGFREATVADAQMLSEWLRDRVATSGCVHDQLAAVLQKRCHELSLEPPSAERVDRIVRGAIHAHEERFYANICERLDAAVRVRLDALLQPADPENAQSAEDASVPAPALLLSLLGDPGRPSLAGMQSGLEKLKTIRKIGLPPDLFDQVSPRELEGYRQRVAVEAPFELRRHPAPTRLTWLAAFVHLRGRNLTDDLVDLLVATIHHIGVRAERKADLELLEDLRCVSGKQNLLFKLAQAVLDKPDGIVREVVFPVVAEHTLRALVTEWNATGPTYRVTLRTVIRNSYKSHYRRLIPQILEALEFRSNNKLHRPVILAIDLVKRYADTKLHNFPSEEEVPIEGVGRGLWRDAVVEKDSHGGPRVNRITYEICVLEALRVQLRCKEIWVVGANRYRNPDEDLPADFDAQRQSYYQALNLPLARDPYFHNQTIRLLPYCIHPR